MKRVYILALALVVFAYVSVSATIINIPDDYPTIQEGIDASADGDTVLVQPGTYNENFNFNGHNIVVASLYLITGNSNYKYLTVIDGFPAPWVYGVVTFANGEDSTALITGFTITDGHNNGIYCNQSDPVIDNNIISDNSSTGIFCYRADATITNNSIVNNIKYVASPDHAFGGGIYCKGSDVIIENNTIEGNVASAEDVALGGGIMCYSYNNAIIRYNTIASNCATGWEAQGGGIYFVRSDGEITNNVITGNLVSGYHYTDGGGIACRLDSNPRIANNIIAENTASSLLEDGCGGGLYCFDSTPIGVNNIFWGNMADQDSEICFEGSSPIITYSDVQGGWEGQGNIDVDPLFRDPASDDFHLMSTECGDPYDSPCIDAGHPDIADTFLDCAWGLGTILSDMGAYGGEVEEFEDLPDPGLNKIVFGPRVGDDAGVLTVHNGEPVGIEMWVRTDPDNPGPIIGVTHGLMSEDVIIAERNSMDPEPEYDLPNWAYFFIDGPFSHDPEDNYPIPEGWTCEMQGAAYRWCPPWYEPPLDTQGEWDLYGTWLMVTNTGIPPEQTYHPFADGWYPHSDQGTAWSWDGGGTIPEQDYCGLHFESNVCDYFPGDCDHNGAPLELSDVLAMIAFYRGTIEPYLCECGTDPVIYNFAATADPNGNCIPNELNDVVTEIGAYRGSDTVSGCPDCPGSE